MRLNFILAAGTLLIPAVLSPTWTGFAAWNCLSLHCLACHCAIHNPPWPPHLDSFLCSVATPANYYAGILSTRRTKGQPSLTAPSSLSADEESKIGAKRELNMLNFFYTLCLPSYFLGSFHSRSLAHNCLPNDDILIVPIIKSVDLKVA
jgi:hypothetical protein